jgi:hypothetical protein
MASGDSGRNSNRIPRKNNIATASYSFLLPPPFRLSPWYWAMLWSAGEKRTNRLARRQWPILKRKPKFKFRIYQPKSLFNIIFTDSSANDSCLVSAFL